MSENLKIGNYTIQTSNGYSYLINNNINESQLAKIDKNKDMIISEDELTEFKEENKKSSSTNFTSESAEETILKVDYKLKLQEINYKNKNLTELYKKSKTMSDKIEALDPDSEDYEEEVEKIQKKLGKNKKEIEKLKSEISVSTDELNNIASKIDKIQGTSTENSSSTTTSTASSTSGANVPITENIPEDLAQRLDAKLGDGFSAKCEQIAANLRCNPNDLLAVMYGESGIDPHCVGYNGAVGLIMFMPDILEANGYSPSAVAAMSAIEQLDVVYKFISESKTQLAGYSENDTIDAGTLDALCFLPAVANKEVLCTTTDSLSWAYSANSPLDTDGNGDISKTDLAQRTKRKYEELYKYF